MLKVITFHTLQKSKQNKNFEVGKLVFVKSQNVSILHLHIVYECRIPNLPWIGPYLSGTHVEHNSGISGRLCTATTSKHKQPLPRRRVGRIPAPLASSTMGSVEACGLASSYLRNTFVPTSYQRKNHLRDTVPIAAATYTGALSACTLLFLPQALALVIFDISFPNPTCPLSMGHILCPPLLV
jgi:hypothetical protein